MQVFRKFDYFRKSTSPEAIKSTFIGGIISICCLVTLGILISNEILSLYEPIIKKNTTVSTDPNKHPHIQLNVDILFPNVPCFLITAEMSTSVNFLDPEHFSRQLTYQHINDKGAVVKESKQQNRPFPDIDVHNKNETIDSIQEFFDNGYQCRIFGQMDLTKVTGQMKFQLIGNSLAFQKFWRDNKKDEKYRIQLNHKINKYSFGSEKAQRAIKRSSLGKVDGGQHAWFNMFMKDGKVKDNLKTQSEDTAQDYFYFIKIVPHTFVDMIESWEQNTYSYSLGHNKKNSDNGMFLSITFILDYAPVKMIISKDKRQTGQIMINLCSIVGGVFVIFGLINSMANSLCKCYS